MKGGRLFFKRISFALTYLVATGLLWYFLTPYLVWTPWLAQPAYFAAVYLVGTIVFLLYGHRRKYFYFEDSMRELFFFCLQGLFVGGLVFLAGIAFPREVEAWWAAPLMFVLYRSGWLTRRKDRRHRR